ITGLARAGNNMIVRWTGSNGPNCRFQLQCRTNLTGTWQDIGLPTSAYSATSAMAQAGMCFFRLKCLTNIAPPSPPRLAGFVPGVGVTHDIVVRSNVAYLASDWFGLSLVSVSNPTAPAVLASANIPFNGQAVDVAGPLACVTGNRTFNAGGSLFTNLSGFYVI